MNKLQILSYLIVTFGLIAVVVGGVFIGLGFSKSNLLTNAMQQEQITLGIQSDKLAAGEVIDTATEAEIAGDTVREHRHTIAPTYGELLGGEQFDPTNPQHLIYAQALNLENYLYLAVLGFGVTQIAMGAGAFMVLTGIAIGATGWVVLKISRRLPAI